MTTIYSNMRVDYHNGFSETYTLSVGNCGMFIKAALTYARENGVGVTLRFQHMPKQKFKFEAADLQCSMPRFLHTFENMRTLCNERWPTNPLVGD